MWVHCHAVALTAALNPCWRGLAATEEPLKVVSGARVREGRSASDQHANCKVFENRPRGHLTRTTGTYPPQTPRFLCRCPARRRFGESPYLRQSPGKGQWFLPGAASAVRLVNVTAAGPAAPVAALDLRLWVY